MTCRSSVWVGMRVRSSTAPDSPGEFEGCRWALLLSWAPSANFAATRPRTHQALGSGTLYSATPITHAALRAPMRLLRPRDDRAPALDPCHRVHAAADELDPQSRKRSDATLVARIALGRET